MFSCKKDKANDDSLIGKWKLTEIYNGYVMGGCFCWTQVPSVNADMLEFFVTGRYKLTRSQLSSISGCSGTYRVLNDTTIAMTYDCQMDPTREFNHKISRQPGKFIIDYQGIEGVIRYKYNKN